MLSIHCLKERQNLCSEIAATNHEQIVTTGTTD